MCRAAWVLPLAVLLATRATPADGQEKSRLAEALVVQEALKEAIKKAEPSVACILVSRSDQYRHFGDTASLDSPGKLGIFDAARARRVVRADDKVQLALIKRLDLSDPDQVPESFGSGVVIPEPEPMERRPSQGGASSLILTNRHVVMGATKIYVRLAGGLGSYADIHADDPRSDLAVLRLLDDKVQPRPLAFGDGGAAQKGEFVCLLANPFAAGFVDGSPSASWGIISNVRRRAPDNPKEDERQKPLHRYGTLLQMDARINVGCSGGALLNLKGEFVGLTTAIAALSGGESTGGFAVPLDDSMKRIIDVLRRGEEVEYGFLGVRFDPEGPRERGGVKVLSVIEGSPAATAGLRGGEYIWSINGKDVSNYDELFLVIGTLLAGSEAKLRVAPGPRGTGDAREVTATLAKFYVPGKVITSRKPKAVGGLRVDWTSILVQPSGSYIPRGVVIREVIRGSAADTARLQPDKVISHVDGRPVANPTEFYRAMAKAQGSVKLTLSTGHGRTDEVTIEIK
jgi:S1-C subfamily serine protease